MSDAVIEAVCSSAGKRSGALGPNQSADVSAQPLRASADRSRNCLSPVEDAAWGRLRQIDEHTASSDDGGLANAPTLELQ